MLGPWKKSYNQSRQHIKKQRHYFANKGQSSQRTALWESLVGKPRGKSSWEILVGKPRGKATDPLIHAKGSVTLLVQLGRKAHVLALTPEED